LSDANLVIKNYFLILKQLLLNERIIELHDIAPKEFWGAQDSHLETIKKYYPKLKIVARGTTLKAYGEKEVLDEFENRFNRLMLHFTRYNNIDTNVIDRVIQSNSAEEHKMHDHDKILVHGIGGKLIKAMTPNQQLMVDLIHKNDMVFAVGPAGTGKTYTGVALAVKALKEKQVKRIILTRPAVEAGENLGFLPGDMKEKLDPYMQPLYDALRDMLPPQTLEDYILKGIIQIAPLAFMRGIFTSTLSENQIVAFILSVFLCFFFYFGFEGIAAFTASFADVVSAIGMDYHYKSISRGVIDTRDVLYFSSVTVLFLAGTVYQLKSLKN